MDDTSPAARRRYEELLRLRTPAERMSIAMSLTRTVRELANAGIRAAYPGASQREVDRRFAERLYGTDVAARLYGPSVDDG